VAEAGLAITGHGCHQRVTQEGEVAVDGGAGAFELLLQARDRHRIARCLEDAVQGQDAFVSVHAGDYALSGAAWRRVRGPAEAVRALERFAASRHGPHHVRRFLRGTRPDMACTTTRPPLARTTRTGSRAALDCACGECAWPGG